MRFVFSATHRRAGPATDKKPRLATYASGPSRHWRCGRPTESCSFARPPFPRPGRAIGLCWLLPSMTRRLLRKQATTRPPVGPGPRDMPSSRCLWKASSSFRISTTSSSAPSADRRLLWTVLTKKVCSGTPYRVRVPSPVLDAVTSSRAWSRPRITLHIDY